MNVNGAVVLVTGASSGIGEATARAAARAGASVVLVARRRDRIDALARELGDALAVVCDVTLDEQVSGAVEAAVRRFGRVDVLVNNAGQGFQGLVDEIKLDKFRELLDLNLVAPLAFMQAVVPLMRTQGGGSIINVSSGATFHAQAGSGAYTSSKAALNMLSDVARVELADVGITVSTIYPFITRSEFYGTVKAGLESARAVEARTAAMAHPATKVADKILELIESGAPRADLVPAQFGGSLQE